MSRIGLITTIGISAFVVLLCFTLYSGERPDCSKSREKNDVTQLSVALKSYKAEYSEYPSGNHAAIMRVLLGNNPKKIAFYDPDTKSLNEKGELVDRWRNPYKIDLTTSPNPHVSSAGKNQLFEGEDKGSDDICSWR